MGDKTEYKYLLFGFDSHEAGGGMEDLIFKFNSLKDVADNFEYKDLYIYQLVDTRNFTFKEFTSNTIYRVEKDSFENIKEKRREELIKWLVEEIT